MKIKKYLSLITFTILASSLYAQKPTEVPKPSEKPIDLSNPADIVIYIVLPLCAILLYFLYKRNKNKHKK